MLASADQLEHVAACVLCGGVESTVWLQASCPERPDETFTIHECSGCGLRYLSPRPIGEALSRYYDADYYSYYFSGIRPRSHTLKLAVWRRLGLLPLGEQNTGVNSIRALFHAANGIRAAWTLPAPHKGARFLDIGSGAGERLELAQDLGWETYGLDLGEKAVVAAAMRGHHTVVGNAETLPFADESIDFLNLSHVLEHTPNPLQVLRECRRVLHPQGVLQLAVPYAASWSARRYGADWRALDVPRHLYHFTARPLRRLAREAGLRVALLRTLPNLWVWEESRKTAGETPPTRLQRLIWQRRSAVGQGDNLDLWCTRL